MEDDDDLKHDHLLNLDVPARDAHLAEIRERLVELLSRASDTARNLGFGEDKLYMEDDERRELDALAAELNAYGDGLAN